MTCRICGDAHWHTPSCLFIGRVGDRPVVKTWDPRYPRLVRMLEARTPSWKVER